MKQFQLPLLLIITLQSASHAACLETKATAAQQEAAIHYAAAPCYKTEIERLHGAATGGQQAIPPQAPTRIMSSNREHDQLLKIVTTEPQLQLLIREYAFDQTMRDAMFNYTLFTHSNAKQVLHAMAISPEPNYTIATLHAQPNNIHLYTKQGDRFKRRWHAIDCCILPYEKYQGTSQNYSDIDYREKGYKATNDCLCSVTTDDCVYGICCVAHTILLSYLCCNINCISCCCSDFTLSRSPTLITSLQQCYCNTKRSAKFEPMYSINLTHNGTILIGTGSGAKSKLEYWNKHGKPFKVVAAHTDTITSIASHNDTIVTGSADMSAKIWNGEAAPIVLAGHTAPINQVTINATYIATGAVDHSIKIWDHSGALVTSIPPTPSYAKSTFALNNDSTLLISFNLMSAAGIRNDVILHYDAAAETHRKGLPLPPDVHTVSALLELTDGRIIIGTQTGHVLFWNVDDTTQLLKQHNYPVVAINELANGVIAVGFKDASIEFYTPRPLASKLFSQCTLEQLTFIELLLNMISKHPERSIPLSPRGAELITTLPAHIQTALKHNCPQLKMP